MIDDLLRSNAPAYRVVRPLPRELGYCVVIEGFLSASECHACVTQAESRGFQSASPDYPPSYRNNDRLVLDDTALADRLYERLALMAPCPVSTPATGHSETWHMDGINSRMRFCRYTPNQQFNIHQDGVHHRTSDWRSMLTFMIYLNDGSEFSGGDTLFYANAPQASPDTQPVSVRLRPKMGTLILFDHGIWHAGEKVTSGAKYIMRSDVLFRRDSTIGPPSAMADLNHQGYVWTLARLDDQRFASGGRDCAIPSVAPASCDRIYELVQVTRSHNLPKTHDEALLIDIDLAILGAAPDRFDEYERDIRCEYSWVPSMVFRMKRRSILSKFLERETIFCSEHFIERYEQPARMNLLRSLGSER